MLHTPSLALPLGPSAPSVVRHILVIRMGAIGDLLMTTPVLRALRRQHPQARISYLLGKGAEPVLQGHPAIDQIIGFDRQADGGMAAFVRFCQRLRALGVDTVVNLQPSLRTLLLSQATGAPRVLRFCRSARVRPGEHHLEHAVDNFLHTLQPLGAPPQPHDRHLDYTVHPTARHTLQAVLARHGVGAGEPLLLINPGASARSRQWPVASLAATLDLAASRHPHWRLLLIGGAGADVALCHQVRQAMAQPQRTLNLAGALDFAQTGALLERAQGLATMDTGPMHLAAAIGTPMVALFGPTSPLRTGPMPAHASRCRAQPIVLQPAQPPDCAPCDRRECRRGDQICLVQHSPERLVQALQALPDLTPMPHWGPSWLLSA